MDNVFSGLAATGGGGASSSSADGGVARSGLAGY